MMCYRAKVSLRAGNTTPAVIFVLADSLKEAVALLSDFPAVLGIDRVGVGISQTGDPAISIPYDEATP